MTRRFTTGCLSLIILCAVPLARAEDQTHPTIQSMIGGFLFDSLHTYVAESKVRLPLLQAEPLSLAYEHNEFTPVLKKGSQTQLLFSREELEAGIEIGEHLRAIVVGGYRNTSLEDRAGFLSAYAVGAGLGSPVGPELSRLEWSVVAGGYAGRRQLGADWWADLHMAWRAYQFDE